MACSLHRRHSVDGVRFSQRLRMTVERPAFAVAAQSIVHHLVISVAGPNGGHVSCPRRRIRVGPAAPAPMWLRCWQSPLKATLRPRRPRPSAGHPAPSPAAPSPAHRATPSRARRAPRPPGERLASRPLRRERAAPSPARHGLRGPAHALLHRRLPLRRGVLRRKLGPHERLSFCNLPSSPLDDRCPPG